jgi:hypothetical protein
MLINKYDLALPTSLPVPAVLGPLQRPWLSCVAAVMVSEALCTLLVPSRTNGDSSCCGRHHQGLRFVGNDVGVSLQAGVHAARVMQCRR